MKVVNLERLVQTIGDMAREYIQLHGAPPRTLIAVGGSAMAMHGFRPISEDIDLYSPEDAFAPVAEAIERQSGLRIDVTSKTTLWGVLNVRDIEADAIVKESLVIEGFTVDIAAISPETLFVIKASTMREKDRDDLPLILPSTTPERIIARLDTLIGCQDHSVAEDTLLNVISEIQLVELEPACPRWFDEAPYIQGHYSSLIKRTFGVDLLETSPSIHFASPNQ